MIAPPTGHRLDQLARLRAAMITPPGRVVLVNVPMCNFLMLDGRGAASSDDFQSAVRALTGLSAAVRLYLQEGSGDLLDPMPLEVIWSSADDDVWRPALSDEWSWTAMVAQPAAVSPQLLAALRDRYGVQDRELLCRIHLGSLREGLCAQTSYSGRVERSAEVVQRLKDHVRSLGYEPHGPYHEVHLVDLRHADVGSLRTIVRQAIHRAT